MTTELGTWLEARRQIGAVLILVLAAASMAGCHGSEARGRQVIVLGIDGMDPGFLERHWSDLPNVARLRDQGGFRRLSTTMPPQSPVAWSTFITGLNPAEHGVFDFVHRDPRTMQPFSSMGRTVEGRFKIPVGPYVLPLSSARVETLRKGEPFWRMLWDRHIPVTILHMPTNFPPERAGRRSRAWACPTCAAPREPSLFIPMIRRRPRGMCRVAGSSRPRWRMAVTCCRWKDRRTRCARIGDLPGRI